MLQYYQDIWPEVFSAKIHFPDTFLISQTQKQFIESEKYDSSTIKIRRNCC